MIDENTLRADCDLKLVEQYKAIESHNFMGVAPFLLFFNHLDDLSLLMYHT